MTAQPSPRQFPRREDYEPAVRTFLPGVDGEELMLRASLLLIRDQAAAAMGYCTDEAFGLLEHVHRLATREAFRSMRLDDLREVRRVLLSVTASASGLQVLFNDIAHHQAGGA